MLYPILSLRKYFFLDFTEGNKKKPNMNLSSEQVFEREASQISQNIMATDVVLVLHVRDL